MNTKLYAALAILAMAFLPTTTTASYYAKTCPTQDTNTDLTAILNYDGMDCGTAGEGQPTPECDSALPCSIEECQFVNLAATVKEGLPSELSPGVPEAVESLAEDASYDVGDACQAIKDLDGLPEVDVPGGVGPHHACPRSEDDPGFGGTHVTCYYSCHKLDLLAITISAEDSDADVSGYTDCGGAQAVCPRTPYYCLRTSQEVARFGDTDQGCVGDSHETWSSKVTVACYAIGPESVLCEVIDCGFATSQARIEDCIRSNPAAPADAIRNLVGQLPAAAHSFVTFEFQGDTGFAVRYDADAPIPCLAGPL